jgi:uncharacterized RDD family membrane protein YckC
MSVIITPNPLQTMDYKNRIERLQDDGIVLAPVRRRLAALLIDCLAIILIYILIMVIFSLFRIDTWKINVKSIFEVEIETNVQNHWFVFMLKVFFGLLPVIYFTLFLYFSKGRTIGKYLLRLKVVSLYHPRLGLWHCFERSLGYFTSALESGFGFIQALWNPNRMALHDKIGETIVISLARRREGVRA